MKRVIIICMVLGFVAGGMKAQDEKLGTLEQLESRQQEQEEYVPVPATIKTNCRLFSDMNNLSSVMKYLEAETSIQVLGQTDKYYLILQDSIEGFVFKEKVDCPQCAPTEEEQAQMSQEQQAQSRFAYLKEKYGELAEQLYANKIWTGMTTEMVLDSWGKPAKITRNITSRHVQEEWVYEKYWLFFENDRLLDWGRIR